MRYSACMTAAQGERRLRIPHVGVRSPARIGRALRSVRTNAGITQAELAERAKVSREVVSRIESGHHSPRADTLAALLSALDYDIAFLPRPRQATT